MLAKGPAKKVTVYLNEDTKYHHQALHITLLEYLLSNGVSGATAIRAMAGFGGHHVIHTPRIELLSEHLPVVVEFIESAERVEDLLPGLQEMVTDGMIEVQDTLVIVSRG